MNAKAFEFKKIFWAYFFCAIPFTILASILALSHVFPINFNGADTYGWKGFIVPILFLPLWVVMFTGLTWLALNFGNWLHTKFLKLIKSRPKELKL